MFRVCIDARLSSGVSGGIESVVIGLAHGLSKLTDGDETYFFLTDPDSDQWLKPYVSGPCKILHVSQYTRKSKMLKNTLLKTALAKKILLKTLPKNLIYKVPYSDGTIEKAGIDVMHFTFQSGFLTNIPNIYHPHDLQHIHLPQYFNHFEILKRATRYPVLCSQASFISVTSEWVRQDLVRQYKLPEDKIKVIVLPPVLHAYKSPSENDISRVREKYALHDPFIFYPAQTWPHKNHISLLEALVILRDHYGIKANFISCGQLNDFYLMIKNHINKLGLFEQVKFLGFIDPLDVFCLYKLCNSVIVPSKFEAMSGPVGEAFFAGAPVACSNVTSLPEQAGDAALIFDPDKPEEIAKAIYQLWTDDILRKKLIKRGETRIKNSTWEKTAKIFRAHYRYLGKRPLNDEDQSLLIHSAKALKIYETT